MYILKSKSAFGVRQLEAAWHAAGSHAVYANPTNWVAKIG